ncbi:hypothetical protein GCM10017786_66990 [Amycolatopsis deserti]|uniref:MFS transporter n=1 Tax=Amycolatopsis deserti TaxID=185696 RepID=A0ABQ3JEH7_9PSEU|nr:hypothetical protein GCM10017786_66990 [Amycolatopsis deserti]
MIGLAQLMVVLDATIVNIALPTAQHELGFSSDARQWVVTAYALAFGSRLLGVFARIERRVAHPLLPMRVLSSGRRSSSASGARASSCSARSSADC